MNSSDEIIALGRDNAIVHAWLTVHSRGNIGWQEAIEKMVISLAAENKRLFTAVVDAEARAMPRMDIFRDKPKGAS